MSDDVYLARHRRLSTGVLYTCGCYSDGLIHSHCPMHNKPIAYRGSVTDLLEDYKRVCAELERLKAREQDRNEELYDRFRELKCRFLQDTRFTSSISDMTAHPAYAEIIDMGSVAVSFMLEDCEREKSPPVWFAALRTLTGADPVPEEAKGRIPEMAKYWVEWGKRNGYLTEHEGEE